jgi:hypothetical protein
MSTRTPGARGRTGCRRGKSCVQNRVQLKPTVPLSAPVRVLDKARVRSLLSSACQFTMTAAIKTFFSSCATLNSNGLLEAIVPRWPTSNPCFVKLKRIDPRRGRGGADAL